MPCHGISVWLLIHLCSKYLLSICSVSGSMLGSGDTTVNYGRQSPGSQVDEFNLLIFAFLPLTQCLTYNRLPLNTRLTGENVCIYACTQVHALCVFTLWSTAPLIDPYCANNTISNNYSS